MLLKVGVEQQWNPMSFINWVSFLNPTLLFVSCMVLTQ